MDKVRKWKINKDVCICFLYLKPRQYIPTYTNGVCSECGKHFKSVEEVYV